MEATNLPVCSSKSKAWTGFRKSSVMLWREMSDGVGVPSVESESSGEEGAVESVRVVESAVVVGSVVAMESVEVVELVIVGSMGVVMAAGVVISAIF